MKAGDYYRHFKGGTYKIVGVGPVCRAIGQGGTCEPLGIARDANEPGKRCAVFRTTVGVLRLLGNVEPDDINDYVVYESLEDGEWWLRTVANFTEQLPAERGGGPRFQLVSA